MAYDFAIFFFFAPLKSLSILFDEITVLIVFLFPFIWCSLMVENGRLADKITDYMLLCPVSKA